MSYEKLVNSNYLYRPVFLNSWDEKDLYDLAIWRNGLAFKKTCFSEKGKPIIKIAELKNGLTEQTKYTNDFFDESVHLTKKDMVFSWSGNPETSIDVFWYDLPDGWLNQHIFKIMVKDGTDRNFFYYLLKYLKPNFTAIASNKQTTGLGHVTINDLKNIIVRQPDLNEQRTIASTLSCLDDMIELNNRNNQVLEEMAQAIFKHWFVDFEFPNQDGQPYKSSGGAMADSELGKIPEGWRVGVLGNVLTLNYGKALPAKKRINGQIRVYSSAGITGFHNQALVNEPSIIVGRKGTIGTVYYSTEPSFCIDTAYYATQKDSQYPLLLMYQILKELKLNQYNEDSAVPGLNRNTVYDIRIIIPPDAILNQYNEILISIYSLIFDNTLRNQTLTATRDTLLPKLMSGEIRVPVEEVV